MPPFWRFSPQGTQSGWSLKWRNAYRFVPCNTRPQHPRETERNRYTLCNTPNQEYKKEFCLLILRGRCGELFWFTSRFEQGRIRKPYKNLVSNSWWSVVHPKIWLHLGRTPLLQGLWRQSEVPRWSWIFPKDKKCFRWVVSQNMSKRPSTRHIWILVCYYQHYKQLVCHFSTMISHAFW